MPWDAKYNDEHNLVELIYKGKVTPVDLQEALLAAVKLANENNSILFFADCSEMEGGHSVVDLYGLISLYESVGLQHRMKEALLLPSLKSPKEDVKFYETACLNKGFNVKVFSQKEKALTWLIE
ncbi:MAG: hypothetical protein WCZ90_08370 [Melioribacteraceae bacterium]